jgi:t-SNARE complex subunit (syntaxin)
MNKDYSKEFISSEIAQLFNSVEEFLIRKDTMVEAIRYMYLHSSCNN